ncbi:MAG TPA: cardiolipin synthase [Eubacteriales bacterium]|nr:cardiolipin synthase [Eubacteriales bacterium]
MRKFKALISSNFIWYAILLLAQIAYIIIFAIYLAENLPLVNIALRLIALIFVVYIMDRPMNPAYKIAWIIPILTFPVFGMAIYLLLRRHAMSRKNRRLLERSEKAIEKYLIQDKTLVSGLTKPAKKQARKIYASAHAPVAISNNVEYFDSGEKYFERLIQKLENAKKFIFLEFFIVSEGELWDEIKSILEYKASHGVDVRLIYDDLGSQAVAPGHMVKNLRKIGIKTYKFNPFRPFFNVQMNNRTHRKIVIIDGDTAFTGGVNIADEYVNKKQLFGHWKDAGVMFTGCGVDTFTLAFLKLWNMRFDEKNYASFVEIADKNEYAQNPPTAIIPFTDMPSDSENVTEDMYLELIYSAEKYVYFFTPYLIIDNEIRTALITAQKSGVDVRIVVPHIPDKKIVFELTKVFYSELVENGITIYEYTDGFIHSKVALSDGKSAYVGTCNLDYRSLFLHLECGVYIDGGKVCEDIEKDFASTFEKSHKVMLEEVKKGKVRSFWHRFLRMFAPLM